MKSQEMHKVCFGYAKIGDYVKSEKWYYNLYGITFGTLVEVKDGKGKIEVKTRVSYNPQFSSKITKKYVWVSLSKIENCETN